MSDIRMEVSSAVVKFASRYRLNYTKCHKYLVDLIARLKFVLVQFAP